MKLCGHFIWQCNILFPWGFCIQHQEGVNFANHTALMIVDTTPFVGNFLDAFLEVTKQSNVPIKYVPLFADEGHQEWFFGHFHQELTKKFLRDELKLPNVTRLPIMVAIHTQKTRDICLKH